MSQKPSWLDDEEVQTKVLTSAAKIAANPMAQKVVTTAVVEDNAPSWARSSSSYTPPVIPDSKSDMESQSQSRVTSGATTTATGDEPKEFDATPEEIKSMNNWRYILSFFYLTAAINLAVASGLSLVGQTNIGLVFFALYVIFFASIICCYELAFGVMKLFISNFIRFKSNYRQLCI
jgi:hypothetical protein